MNASTSGKFMIEHIEGGWIVSVEATHRAAPLPAFVQGYDKGKFDGTIVHRKIMTQDYEVYSALIKWLRPHDIAPLPAEPSNTPVQMTAAEALPSMSDQWAELGKDHPDTIPKPDQPIKNSPVGRSKYDPWNVPRQ